MAIVSLNLQDDKAQTFWKSGILGKILYDEKHLRGFLDLLIENVNIYTPDTQPTFGWVLLSGTQIKVTGVGEFKPAEFRKTSLNRRVDGKGSFLLPGFIDIHLHGAYGCDLLTASAEEMSEMAKRLLAHGVTGFLPTSFSAEKRILQQFLQNVCHAMSTQTSSQAQILGAHLEGPYLNEKHAGFQDKASIQAANPEDLRNLLAGDAVRLITLAPEIPAYQAFIEECVAKGVYVSAGHTNASLEELQTAARLGLRGVTHVGNGMAGLHHRLVGTFGAALAMDELYCEMIADNAHIHPLMQKVIARSKGEKKLILVSDALAPAGLSEGVYPVAGRQVKLTNGALYTSDGMLAGSATLLDKSLQNLSQNSGWPLSMCQPASSTNAAEFLGIADRKGYIKPGYDADLVMLDENLEVQKTFIQGKIVYEKF